MKIKIKKVYYCDYCNKHSLMPLVKHEKHCTGNMNRECNMCKWLDYKNNVPKTVMYYLDKYEIDGIEDDDKENVMNEILNKMHGCPACTLTVFRAIKNRFKNKWYYFDYKKALNEYKNKANAESSIENY